MAGFVGTAIGLSLQAKALAGGATSFTALATSLFTTACGGVSAALLAVMTFNLEAGIRRNATAKGASRIGREASETFMRDRSSIWIGLADLLLCVLSVVIVAVAPKEPALSGVPEKAEYLMSAEWSVDLDADVDIWLIPPSKKPVFYGSRDVGCARLDSDNRGFIDERITLADGSKVKVEATRRRFRCAASSPAATISG